MTPEIREIMAEIKARKRPRQWDAAHAISTGIVAELPRCPGCGGLAPWCECQDREECREAREPVRYIWQDGKPELY